MITVHDFPAGTAPTSWEPGDLLCTHNSIAWWKPEGVTSAAIRLGQRLAFRSPELAPYCWTNHVALVVGTDGSLIEALGAGVSADNADKYRAQDYRVVHTHSSPTDAARFVAYARSRVGARYGFVEIVSLALTCLTGTKFLFMKQGTYICSALAACALAQTGVVFPYFAVAMMPADIALFYMIKP